MREWLAAAKKGGGLTVKRLEGALPSSRAVIAGTGRFRASAVLMSAATGSMRSISGVLANLANLDLIRKLSPPSGARSTRGTTGPNVAARAPHAEVPAPAGRPR